jgi:FtsH-binding integral membrane protein
MIRLSLIYLAITIIIGGLLLIHKAVPVHPAVWGLLPVHFELAIWGWIIQFVMGTAYWMFPRFMKGKPRGSTNIATLMVYLFNGGLLLLLLSIFDVYSSILAPAGRGLLLFSVTLFAALIWNRILSYRKRTYDH